MPRPSRAHRGAALLGILALLLESAACSGSAPASGRTPSDSASTSTGPKRLRASVMSDPPVLSFKLNPVSNVAGVDGLDDLLHVGLSTIDDHSVLQPRLAEAVPSVENGLWTFLPDGRMQTTWRIRPNARWHD